ncbi:uncharacterized protein B0H18DRAFT_1207958 [Fomitopsis serialis]|uniref:uncharacterized protein n=1 Tax=Fomitopsis serialis TaxID=139415 RepID=UPI002007A992|nr:uncharacterized protein B0H18DRAFT_1207958 [Neoantrodia serialis]KAH9933807.1 hypothetical protein B0H18DRAFT_1207958 [Neoantrodia serialis]
MSYRSFSTPRTPTPTSCKVSEDTNCVQKSSYLDSAGGEHIAPGDAIHSHVKHKPQGPICARIVLLCINGYTSHLLPALADLIVPMRGEMSALLPPKGAARLPNS